MRESFEDAGNLFEHDPRVGFQGAEGGVESGFLGVFAEKCVFAREPELEVDFDELGVAFQERGELIVVAEVGSAWMALIVEKAKLPQMG